MTEHTATTIAEPPASCEIELVPTRPEHLPELASWFTTQRAIREWGGPKFRFPFDPQSFRSDSRYDELPSYSLQQLPAGELLGFGQYYLRDDRCHLARLVIAPAHRGRRLGAVLIDRLAAIGCTHLRVTDCSLFVLSSNAAAVRLYERIGFVGAAWPASAPPLAGCRFMLRQGPRG